MRIHGNPGHRQGFQLIWNLLLLSVPSVFFMLREPVPNLLSTSSQKSFKSLQCSWFKQQLLLITSSLLTFLCSEMPPVIICLFCGFRACPLFGIADNCTSKSYLISSGQAPCLVALYLLSKFLSKRCTKQVLKDRGTWPGTGSPGPYTGLSSP